METIVPIEVIERKIYIIRGQKVMLDSDLAELYNITTKVLVQAVKRNLRRFPADFMFQLTNQEVAILRSQFVTSSWGGRRYVPYAFTEQGVAMLSMEKKYDAQFKVVFDAIRQLMTPPEPREKKIGFRVRERKPRYRTSIR